MNIQARISFFPDNAGAFGIGSSAHVACRRLMAGDRFSTDVSALTDFGNVGATSIQILALLGFRRIGMVGVDARYAAIDEKTSVADKDGFVTVDDDPNHFCAEYVRGKRLRAQPDLKKLVGQWPRVATECKRNGLEVRNASPGSALAHFPATDFASAIAWVACG
jgi:hypothetical protein